MYFRNKYINAVTQKKCMGATSGTEIWENQIISPQDRLFPVISKDVCVKAFCPLNLVMFNVALFPTTQSCMINALRLEAYLHSSPCNSSENYKLIRMDLFSNWLQLKPKHLHSAMVAEFKRSSWHSQRPEWVKKKKKNHGAFSAPSTLQKRRNMGMGFLEELSFIAKDDEWQGFGQIR